MTNLQIATVNMFLRVKQIFGTYATIFSAYKPLKKKTDQFDTQLNALDADIKTQSLGTGGVTDSKEAKKATAIKLVNPLAQKGYAYAEEVNDANLLALFDVTDKDFTGDEVATTALMENIVAAIVTILKDLEDYNVTQQQVDDATAAITNFKTAIGSPQVQTSALKVMTAGIVADIKAIKATLKTCDKLITAEFRETENKAYKEYKEARKIGTVTTSHTQVSFHIFEDDAHTKPIAGAIASIDSIKRNDTSDADGIAEIIKLPANNYNATIKATGFKDAAIAFTVKRGEHKEVDVVLGV